MIKISNTNADKKFIKVTTNISIAIITCIIGSGILITSGVLKENSQLNCLGFILAGVSLLTGIFLIDKATKRYIDYHKLDRKTFFEEKIILFKERIKALIL